MASMNNILKRIKILEDGNKALVTAVYHFNPKLKTVYRTTGQYADKVRHYMDWDTVINDEYTVFETIIATPNYSNPNWEEESDGEWNVCVQGHNVINENN